MGLIVPQTVRIKTSSSNYKHYKEKGYEFKKCGDFIEVNVLDLYSRSTAKVKVICDICGKESEMWYRTVVKCNKENKLITCGSDSCIKRKREDTCTKKYGVKCSFQAEEVREKIENTNLERYGSKSPLGSKEIRNKSEKTWQENYGEGIINPFQAEEVKEKIKQTNLEHHGCKYPMQNEEIQNKFKDTCMKRYNVDNPNKAQEIKDKKKNTCQLHFKCDCSLQDEGVREKSIKTWQKKYGKNVTSPAQAESVKEKSKQTLQKKYGKNIINSFQVESVKEKSKQTLQKKYGENITHPMQVEEIKNKVLDSFQFNHTGPSSRAQRYINYILNGTLNKRICGSLADIYIEKENIIIEHDGSGHFLNDKMNGNETPTKESLLYEKEREDKIINNGYRMIRFIAAKDRIPSDEVILNLIEGFKNLDFKVIRINFEEGTIDRDYEEKWCCNFGELRKITKEDLEKFEKQEENISEN